MESVFCVKKHLQDSPFKIFNASAGSGKTHTLTRTYLEIVLQHPGSYRQILAITFTNKAVNEMKHRILDSLYQFGKVQSLEDATPLFLDLMQVLQLEVTPLRERSKKVLKEILHNYAFFDISTIDRFTHRLIRTFAKDLKLPQNFEVVLDYELLLDEAVSRLLLKAGSDGPLTKVILKFALEKIDEDKSWDVGFDLFNIGKLLFNENHAPHLAKLKDKSLSDFTELKKNLKKQSEALEQRLTITAAKGLSLIADAGLEASDFTRSYFPKFLEGIADGNLTMDFNAGWKQHFETASLYNKTASETVKDSIDTLHPELLLIFNQIRETHYRLSFLENAYRHIVPLTVLNAIQREVRKIQAENEQLSISEFNALISKEIKNQPAPFIYERLGEKYRHYFIDEFQDTSAMQWNNLVPLIGNALESEDLQGKKGSVFLVGDAKQAIYRWRGGRAEQFLDLANGADTPFVIPPHIESLPVNYRSHEEIVEFNNDFFTAMSLVLHNERYRNLFIEGNRQRHTGKNGGHVRLSFIEDQQDGTEDKNQAYCEKVLETIRELIAKQYGYQDICILVRGRKEGMLLADFLSQQALPTMSSESLLLKSSEKVRFLVQLMLYASNDQNREAVYEILAFLSAGQRSRHDFISQNLDSLPFLLKEKYGFDLEKLRRGSLYDTMELAIKKFDLAPAADAYITYFMDVVFEVEQKEHTGIQAFLSYWDKKQDKLGISAPENIDAIRIMTIHKAKGLEFPVVIFPFANDWIYKRRDKKMWLPVDAVVFNGFEELLIGEKKEVENYGETAAAIYREEEQKMELDAINVLYVALTRAEKALYVISEKALTKDGEPKLDYYSGLFIGFLMKKMLWEENRVTYDFGSLGTNMEVSKAGTNEPVPFRYTEKNRPEFSILTTSGMLWDAERQKAITKGNELHHILSLIETEDDVEPAFELALRQGTFTKKDVESLKKSVAQVVNHPDLAVYYKTGNRIYNEREIILENGEIVRPDRVVLQDNKAIILDYKTGIKDARYGKQLDSYADAIKKMGYDIMEKIIVYINDTVTLEHV